MNSAENYRKICDRIAESAAKCGRNLSEISLIAVTKNIPWVEVLPVYEAGCRNFAENRLPEAFLKQGESPEDVQWHFIGTLQKNKTRKIIERFSLIHSVDTPELAKKISENSLEDGTSTSILLQVNTSGEKSKHGLSSEEWAGAFEEVIQHKGILIEGLMTMAPLTEDHRVVRHCFSELRRTREKLLTYFPNQNKFLHLSMGMSHDFPIAIEEGATLLRIGSAIFHRH